MTAMTAVTAAMAATAPASERLALSRERLRQALAPSTRQTRETAEAGGPGASPWLQLLFAVATSLLVSTARRHPLALVAGALGFGGLLFASRPWRWWPRRALPTELLARWLLHGLSRPAPRRRGAGR